MSGLCWSTSTASMIARMRAAAVPTSPKGTPIGSVSLPLLPRPNVLFASWLDGQSSRLRYNPAMPSRVLEVAVQKRLVEQWRETGRVLAEIRRAELASQSPEESRRAAWDMLQLGAMLPRDPVLEHQSGLVEMQRLFAKLRSGGFA